MGKTSVSRDEVRAVFSRCRVLSEISESAIESLLESARVRTFAKGEAFVREGFVPDYFGVILSGHVRSVHFNNEGRPITFLVGWPGDAVGLMAMQAARPAQADVEAAEPTQIAVISRSAFEELLTQEPRLGLAVLEECTRQLFEVMGVVKSLSIDVASRIANYVLQRIPPSEHRSSGPVDVDLGVTRVELAAALGTVPETLSRAFATLQDEELITSKGRTVTVLDIAALEMRASGDGRETVSPVARA